MDLMEGFVQKKCTRSFQKYLQNLEHDKSLFDATIFRIETCTGTTFCVNKTGICLCDIETRFFFANA